MVGEVVGSSVVYGFTLSATIRAPSFAIDLKRRKSHGARRLPPIRPKLLPNITIVSKRPSSGPTCVTESSRTSFAPRFRATSIASGDVSIPTTSCPRS